MIPSYFKVFFKYKTKLCRHPVVLMFRSDLSTRIELISTQRFERRYVAGASLRRLKNDACPRQKTIF